MSPAALLLLALQAGAPGSLTFDVRCMVTLGQLAQSTDPALKRAGEVGSQYYFGRFDARVDDAELEQTLRRETQGMQADQQGETLRACGAYMEQRGRRLSGIGDRISASEGAGQQQR